MARLSTDCRRKKATLSAALAERPNGRRIDQTPYSLCSYHEGFVDGFDAARGGDEVTHVAISGLGDTSRGL